MGNCILTLDQGTTSSRAILFDAEQNILGLAQKELTQIYPREGWVEHDPMEIWSSQSAVMMEVIAQSGVDPRDIAAIGLANQRETTVVWDRATGLPAYNAICWQCRRTAERVDRLRAQGLEAHIRNTTGLLPDAYFSATKLSWILDRVDPRRERARRGELLFGTVDSWLVWKLTGGRVHVTDATNASRTMLYDIHRLRWDDTLLQALDIPAAMLPEVAECSQVYGETDLAGARIPIAGMAGDQQAALFGQTCFAPGEAKNTYGTGCFLLMNTGEEIVFSDNGLLTTLCYKIGNQKAVYALEGSIAVAGSLIQWLRDNLNLIETAPEVEEMALTVEDNGGVYFVPAFSGLFAPYWRDDARGAIVGMTRYNTKGHLARAALESTAFQTREVLDAMDADAGVKLKELKVDGGMIANNTLMQFQADVLGVDVVAPAVAETTALGAAYAAGIAVDFWEGEADVIANWQEAKRWKPNMEEGEVQRTYRLWKKAVTKSMDWVDEDVK